MNPANQDIAISDSDLLRTFLDGDEDGAPRAFQELVTRYERLVWTVCRRQLNNRCDIEDAFQITFMLLATKANRIRNPNALANWLYGVALRTSTRLRKQRREMPVDEEIVVMDDADSPLESIARQFQTETIDRQLNLLDEKYRVPLVMHYFAGFTARQIAGRLGVSLAAVEGRLRRGKAKLRVELTGQGILLSPTMLAICLTPCFRPDAALVATTCERCITTFYGTATGGSLLTQATSMTGSLNTGTRLMICKCAVSLAIVSLFTAGGVVHLTGGHHAPGVTRTTMALNATPANASDLTLTMPQDEDESDGVDAPREHRDHFRDIHRAIHLHAHYLMRWLIPDGPEQIERTTLETQKRQSSLLHQQHSRLIDQ